MPIKIMIIDDEEIIRLGIKTIITNSGKPWEVVGEAANADEALAVFENKKPDVLVMDIKMPGIDGLTLSQLFKDRMDNIIIILLSGYAEFSFAQQALRVGILDYLLKPTKPAQLIKALDKAECIINGVMQTETSILRKSGQGIVADSNKAMEYGIALADNLNCKSFVANAVEYINKNYAGNINLKKICAELYVNTTYFSECFKKDTGISFLFYLTIVRVDNAKRLIRERSHLKTYEIADLVGYSDTKHFSRVFKKLTGVNPSELR